MKIYCSIYLWLLAYLCLLDISTCFIENEGKIRTSSFLSSLSAVYEAINTLIGRISYQSPIDSFENNIRIHHSLFDDWLKYTEELGAP